MPIFRAADLIVESRKKPRGAALIRWRDLKNAYLSLPLELRIRWAKEETE